jgi:hypothetical protein
VPTTQFAAHNSGLNATTVPDKPRNFLDLPLEIEWIYGPLCEVTDATLDTELEVTAGVVTQKPRVSPKAIFISPCTRSAQLMRICRRVSHEARSTFMMQIKVIVNRCASLQPFRDQFRCEFANLLFITQLHVKVHDPISNRWDLRVREVQELKPLRTLTLSYVSYHRMGTNSLDEARAVYLHGWKRSNKG